MCPKFLELKLIKKKKNLHTFKKNTDAVCDERN